MGVPSAARFVAKVRRKSCNVQPATPLALSSAALLFDQPLNFVSFHRAKNSPPDVDRRAKSVADIVPIGNVCSRPFFVISFGSVIVSAFISLGTDLAPPARVLGRVGVRCHVRAKRGKVKPAQAFTVGMSSSDPLRNFHRGRLRVSCSTN